MNNMKVIEIAEIKGKSIPIIEGGFGKEQKIMFSQHIADIHGVETKYITKQIKNNIEWFNENDVKDVWDNGNFKVHAVNLGIRVSNVTKNVYVLSERGYMTLLSLMENTETKKDAMKEIIDKYFTMRAELKENAAKNRQKDLVYEIWNGGAGAIEASKIMLQLETKEIRDGNDKVLTAAQVVKMLEVADLTTGFLHEWLAWKNLGTYKKPAGEKRRVFQPNEHYFQLISGEGYSYTGKTNKGAKVVIIYNVNLVERIKTRWIESLQKFVHCKKNGELLPKF